MDQNIIYEGRGVTTGYEKGARRTVIHENLDFTLYSGELTCLLGCNGAGKSTLLRSLTASQPVLGGELLLMGKRLEEYTERERSKNIGIVLTERTQSGGLTVYELVALGRQPHTGFFGRLTRNDKELVAEAIEAVGMKKKTNCYVAELSDGERQKAMIAKALVQECPLIILDEPTAFLDVESRIEIMTLLRKVATEESKAVLLSTHDVEQAMTLGDRLWAMTTDRKMYCGVTEDLVLCSVMNRLFEHPTISFDQLRGCYQSIRKNEKAVSLHCAEPSLYYWAQNALERNGYDCVHTSDGQVLPTLSVESPDRIIWTEGKAAINFGSFAELITYLRTLKAH